MIPPRTELSSYRPERLQKRAILLGMIVMAICFVAAFFETAEFFHAYLVGFFFWLGIALGSLALLLLYHLTGGMWGFMIRRPLEAATRTLPLVGAFMVPLLFGLGYLYPWSRSGASADPELLHKLAYLNIPFFIGRALFYFLIWVSMAWWLSRISARQDDDGDESLAVRLMNFSGPAMIVYALTMTFAGWDWVMSVRPKWHSTIFGMQTIAGQGLSALVFMVVVITMLAGRDPYARIADSETFRDLGNLMLMFVMLWGYLAFSQFLIVWQGNIKSEIQWYLPRMKSGWLWVGVTLVALYLFLPLLILLMQGVKRRRIFLASVAALLLAMRWLDLVWLIEPNFHETALHISWLDVAIPLGLGGFWITNFVAQLRSAPLLTLRDPRVLKGEADV